jgi:hypothetical protein
MGEMEWALMDSYQEDHAAIITAISNLEKLGYLVEGICCKDGILNITCRPHKNDKNGSGKPAISMDGVSDTFKP